MPTSTDRCEYCGAPGPFKGGACYGCIQLINLAGDLSKMRDQLTAITYYLEQDEANPTSLTQLKLVCQDLSQLLARIDRYTND